MQKIATFKCDEAQRVVAKVPDLPPGRLAKPKFVGDASFVDTPQYPEDVGNVVDSDTIDSAADCPLIIQAHKGASDVGQLDLGRGRVD